MRSLKRGSLSGGAMTELSRTSGGASLDVVASGVRAAGRGTRHERPRPLTRRPEPLAATHTLRRVIADFRGRVEVSDRGPTPTCPKAYPGVVPSGTLDTGRLDLAEALPGLERHRDSNLDPARTVGDLRAVEEMPIPAVGPDPAEPGGLVERLHHAVHPGQANDGPATNRRRPYGARSPVGPA